MAAPVAVESQGQPREPRRQQVEPRLELAPQRHEPEVRDVAVDEREDTTRLIVRVEPDRPGPPSTARLTFARYRHSSTASTISGSETSSLPMRRKASPTMARLAASWAS